MCAHCVTQTNERCVMCNTNLPLGDEAAAVELKR